MTTKIRTDLLSQFPNQALSELHQTKLLSYKEQLPPFSQESFPRLLKVIDAFLHSSNTELTLKTFNSGPELNALNTNIVTFIYRYIEGTETHRYNFSRYTQKLFCCIASNANIKLKRHKLSKRSIHSDIQALLENPKPIHEGRLEFYQGWVVLDNKGMNIDVELSFLREAYGDKATNDIFNAFKKLCRANKKETVSTYRKHFIGLLKYFLKLAPTFEKLKQHLQKNNAVYYLTIIFNIELKKHLLEGKSGSSFCRAWKQKMFLYKNCFITHSIFEEPIFPLPTPRFKREISLPGSHNQELSNGSHSSGIFNNKLITKIPLRYNDNDAIREIVKDIRRDINHVLHVCDKAITHNYKKLNRFRGYRELTSPKNLGEYRNHSTKQERLSIACSTFSHYLWDHPGQSGGYCSFLGYAHKTTFLNNLLCIPTYHILYPLIFKLIHEHPKITESWLVNWQLFNENGKLEGIIESGNALIIQSVKKRKGMADAQQIITLNDESKNIVEKILEHTELARRYLKSKDNDDYRYVLLKASSANSIPSRIKGCTNLKKILSGSVFIKSLKTDSPYASKERALEISESLTINRFRASSGVEVFLKTNSVKKMCDALGHKEPKSSLVQVYLPPPIMRYFQDRWIRIFQNAIVFEAMKDSKYLHDSIDISPSSLEEFLENHQLKRMSGHIWEGNIAPKNSCQKSSQNGSIVLSTPLLRVLLFFFNGSKEDIARIGVEKTVLETWMQVSTFIITQIEYQLNASNLLTDEFDDTILEMYKEAANNPLTLKHFAAGTFDEAS